MYWGFLLCVVSTSLATLEDFITNTPGRFQFRFESDSDFTTVTTDYLEFLGNFSSVVPEVTNSNENIWKLVTVEQLGATTTVSFVPFPVEENVIGELARKWANAVTAPSIELVDAFPGLDRSFPPTVRIDIPEETTTSPPTSSQLPTSQSFAPDEGGNAGVVVGAVLGGLVVAGLVGGGAYAWKKRSDKNSVKAPENLTDATPGKTHTPGGLSNINIQGEVTPNPHNY